MRNGKTKFYDSANFPHGFSRSGLFTIKEAEVLETYGRTLKALSDGVEKPSDDDETQFINEITEQTSAQSTFTKVWKKYLTRTNTKVRLLTLTGNSRSNNENTTDTVDEAVLIDDD